MATPKDTIHLGQLGARFLRDSDDIDGRLSLSKLGPDPDDSLFIPRDAVHGFVNNGAETTRTLTMLTPGLIGPAHFREIAAFIAAGGPPDPAKVAEVMAKHGLVVAGGA